MSGATSLVKATADTSAVNLEDGLSLALLVIEHEPHNSERAAVRWIGRLCLERQGLSLAEVTEVLDAFMALVEEPEAAESRLRRLAGRPG